VLGATVAGAAVRGTVVEVVVVVDAVIVVDDTRVGGVARRFAGLR
jgi:hypothetical protein